MALRALTTLAMLSSALAGTLTITNNANKTVYAKLDGSNGINGIPFALAAASVTYLNINGTGNALKFSSSPDISYSTEFDYTVTDALYYQTSSASGLPVVITAKPVDDKCVAVTCPPSPIGMCATTKACAPGSNVALVLTPAP